MSAELFVIYRPRRRNHLSADGMFPLCGTTTSTDDIVRVNLDAAGGPTPRLCRQLALASSPNTCKRCQRLTGMVLFLYSVRDTGKVMKTW